MTLLWELEQDTEVVVSSTGGLIDPPSVKAIQSLMSNPGNIPTTCDGKAMKTKTNLKAWFGW